MTYAIIETGGKQLRVEPGRFYDIELLSAEPDQAVNLETVLLVQHNGNVTIGQPFVDGATVEGTVMRHLRGRKVIVYKMQPKKKTRKKRGHRQEITRLMINSISLNGSVLTSEAEVTGETQRFAGAVSGDYVDQAQADAIAPVADAEAVEVAAENIPETTDEAVTEVTTEVVSEVAPETTDEPAMEVAEITDEPATEVAEIAAEPEAESKS